MIAGMIAEMNNARGIFVTVWLSLLCLFNSAYALDVPDSVRAFLLSKGRADLVARYEAIHSLSPQEFVEELRAGGVLYPVGAGFNGITHRDDHGRITKFTMSILAGLGKVELVPALARVTPAQLAQIKTEWAGLLTLAGFQDKTVAELRGREEPVGSQPASEDLLGSLIFAAYNPRHTPLPDIVSNDGLATRSQFFEGVTFLQILESQRLGTDLHKRYNMVKLWREVIFWQRVAETMLRDSGLTIDLCTPGNMIVSGTYDDPRIDLVDHALIRLSDEAKAYFASIHWKIPEPPAISDAVQLIVWPAISEHVVFSRLWDLSFDQALDYLMAYNNYQDRGKAVERLAEIPKWTIVEAPFLGNYANIEQAQALVNFFADCEKGLIRK